MKESVLISIISSLNMLHKKGEVSGNEIITTLEKLCDISEIHLYSMINERVIRPTKIANNILEYRFRISDSNVSDKKKISKIFDELPPDDNFFLIATYPDKEMGDKFKVEQLYPHLCRLIMSAKKSIMLLNPYFDERGIAKLLPYLKEAAKRDVKIKLIYRKGPESSNFLETIKKRVANNLELVEFGGSGYYLHAKCIIMDEKAAYVGSANITGTSLGSNLELGVLFRGKKVKQLSQFIDKVVSSGSE